ncbi:MAG: LysR family transcriptional regulator [Proteobacteria bacterium]|nr:LysR family transcriptional regulator [Pseudomonadota bacterium]
MNLRQIEVFHAVYVSGSVTAAARALHVSQPSVSKTLRHTESGLGFALFRRLKGRLLPTEEARVLFREVDEVYGRLSSLRLTARNLKSGGASHVGLAVLPSLGLSVAPAAIAQFRAQNPRVTFDVQTLDHADILKCLYERESDLAVGFVRPDHPRLQSVEIGGGELVLLHPKGVLESGANRVDVGRLKKQPYISLTGSGPIGILLSEELQRLEIELREVVSVRTFYVAAALVRQSVGVTIVDEFTARAMQAPNVAFSRLNPAIRFGVHCIWLEERPPSRTAQRFIEALTRVVREPEA